VSEPGDWQRVKSIFQEALDRTPETREAFLAVACGDDVDLRRDVQSLLAAESEAGRFLSRPAIPSSPAPDLEGRRVGPYRVQERIGQGGMGVVYRALRDDDVFHKTVALKLVQGAADPEQPARLARERQILARLQHPNIATILDGGTTDEGQAYLVMEYVDGQPIDRYCDERALSTRERLILFHTVCAAVHYAHQNLVVHRDLKPANVVVTADGQPKLLDFGIAKLLAGGIDPDQAPTATLLPMMTPEYASPEQVRGQPITTASDVYSLGVVLYELLAGERPYLVRADSLEEIVRAVCETEPRLPSAAVQSASATATRSPAELRGDLDTIVLKAMRKEPSRRYLSALELGEDIRRHLAGLPVLARKDTVRYRLTKFVGRHRTAAAAAALVLVSLVGGLVATVRQARIAEANRLRAERRFADVRTLANSFLFEFHDAIKDVPGTTAARRLVVERAAQHLDALQRDAEGDLGLQRELAAAYQRLGEAQGGTGEGNLGDTAGARASYAKALAIRQALAASPGEPADVEALADLELKLSRVLAFGAEWDRAIETARSSATRLEAVAGKSGADLGGRLADVYHTLGFLQAWRGDEGAALDSLQKARSYGEVYLTAHPGDLGARASVARIHADLAQRLVRRGEHRDAVALVHSAWTTLEELSRADPTNARYRRELVYALNVGAEAIESTAGADAGNRSRARALALAEALVTAEPGNQWDQINLAHSLQLLGAGLVRAGMVADGLARLRQACRSAEAIAAAAPDSPFHQGRVAEVRAELAFALAKQRLHPAEMCASLRTSLATWDRLHRAGQFVEETRAPFDEARALLSRCPGTPR
jgi:non-specific serine/threonine protein kinase/serine/threonine-protein kinase